MSIVNPLAIFLKTETGVKFLAIKAPSLEDNSYSVGSFYEDFYIDDFEEVIERMEETLGVAPDVIEKASGLVITTAINGDFKNQVSTSMKVISAGRFRKSTYQFITDFLHNMGFTDFTDFGGDDANRRVIDLYVSQPLEVRSIIIDRWLDGENGITFNGLLETLENKIKKIQSDELGELLDLDGFVLDETHLILVTALDRLTKEKGYANAFLLGASGTGKTTLAKKFAEATGRKFLDVNSASIQNPEEWFGYREAEDASTKFVESELARALREGGVVVLLDEINRIDPANSNALYEVLDDRRVMSVHGEKVPVAPDTVFFMSANIGWQYVGTFSLDTALENRADMRLVMRGLSEAQEVEQIQERVGLDKKQAFLLVDALTKVRYQFASNGNEDVDLSFRTTLKLANLLKVGLNLKNAFIAVLGDLDKSTLDLIN